MRAILFVLAVAVTGLSMCGGGKKESEAKSECSRTVESSFVSGIVEETMDAANYTYIRIKTPEEDIWAAGPKTAVKVGEKVSIENSSPMKDFRSQTLDRTFPKIYFSNQIITDAHGPNCNH